MSSASCQFFLGLGSLRPALTLVRIGAKDGLSRPDPKVFQSGAASTAKHPASRKNGRNP